jgi:hypothetical protein
MQVLAGLVGLATVVWVGLDARRRDWSGNRIGNKTWQWVVGALFVWIIVIPLYLYQRTRVPLKPDFAGEDLGDGPHRRSRWIVPLAVVLAMGVLAVAGVGGWHHLRLDRANALAVKYGAAGSKGEASLADRCVGVMREAYETTDDPGKAGVPPKTYALLAPKVCALGVERGLVKSDGTMSEEGGRELTFAVIERMGPARVQTLIYTELAVDQYHLAPEGEVTRWHRCVAMGYGGFDAQPSKSGLPPRDQFRRAVRSLCTVAIKRGLIPPSGAPQPNTPEWDALQQLLAQKVLGASSLG